MHDQHVPDPAAGQACRVLIAASDHRMRSALRALVEATGRCTIVAEAHSAQEARSLALSLRPQLILLDLLFPTTPAGLDAVRSLVLGNTAPIVVISAQATLRAATLAAGATAFVVQGDNEDALLDLIARATSQLPPISS